MYGLIDHYKNNETPISEFKNIIGHCTVNDKARAMFVYRLVENIIAITKEMGFRDYTDQLVHSLTLLSQHPELITQYEHILVDEYQDVNDIQVKLLGVLQPKNLFVVGDPRQSIYGWRGSKIKHIMKFPEEHEDCAVVQLTKNYRSTEDIVRVSNSIIKPMHLPDLISNSEKTEKKPLLLKHKDEASELQFIAQSILACDVAPNDIFVLARTNKQLEKMKEELARHGISFLIRTAEDQKQDMNPTEEQITLSTVHAIKGLEAKLVYLIGVTSKMYPCLVSDHPVIDMAKLDTSYDKEDEELRLLYVAMTRAKEQLVVNYYGSLSKFVSKEVKQLFSVVDNTIGMRVSDVSGTGVGASSDLMTRLKEWRMQVARQSNVLPYMVLPDRVFLQLITMKPSSIAQLHDINGLGPTKIMHYGDDLLDIINGF
jgi:superfamily I DNA/RNA helicase